MATIERLLYQPCTIVAPPRNQHSAGVQVVLRGGCRFLVSELDQDMPQFASR